MVDNVFLYIVRSGNKPSLDTSSVDNVTLISSLSMDFANQLYVKNFRKKTDCYSHNAHSAKKVTFQYQTFAFQFVASLKLTI